MAFYLVRARPKPERMEELRMRLRQKEFLAMQPFGRALTKTLENARRDPVTGGAVWEEEDYCTPPLAMERAAVLDRYFDDLRVEPVREGEGWQRIAEWLSLWEPPAAFANPDPAIEVLTWDDGQGPVCDWTTGRCDTPDQV